jgi:plasmid stabilization system protein ParE
MTYKLSYFDEAKTDVREAKFWYKRQQIGLEKRFAASIKYTLSRIVNNPFMCAVRYKNIRIAHPKEFPYGIHYYIDNIHYELVIIAIIHNKRDVNMVLKRL